VVCPLIIQASVGIDLNTTMCMSQYAFGAENAKRRYLRGFKHKELMIFADRNNIFVEEETIQHDLREQRQYQVRSGFKTMIIIAEVTRDISNRLEGPSIVRLNTLTNSVP
jgi:hypothetical protein